MTLPKRFPDRDEAAAVREEAERLEPGAEAGEVRRLAGRVMGRREHGKLVFLDLVDRSGRIQLLCAENRVGRIDVDLGDVVGATGVPAKTRRGEPSLAVRELELLAKTKRRDFLVRTRLVSAIRRYLDEHGFAEVETPVLQPRYGGAFAEPFVTRHNQLDVDLYLRIATELYLKRLIVGGLDKVYELGKDFRNEGLSYKHQPEFTMLEWYEAYADYRDTMARIEELVATVAEETLGTTKVAFRGNEIELAPPWRRVKLVDALEGEGVWTRDEGDLRGRLGGRGIDTSRDRSWAELVDHALSQLVEPKLIQPTIVHDYPLELSPFARATDDDPQIVERFEYFAGGIELGNAFTEINEADEQAERFELQRAEAGGEPGDPDYVEALSYGMPPTGGLGLGIDRLAMLLTGRETIRDVVLFPTLRES
jgi:lysyl-tRNA synthetase, class II